MIGLFVSQLGFFPFHVSQSLHCMANDEFFLYELIQVQLLFLRARRVGWGGFQKLRALLIMLTVVVG